MIKTCSAWLAALPHLVELSRRQSIIHHRQPKPAHAAVIGVRCEQHKQFVVIEERFPDSLAAKSERAYLAAYANDAQKARKYLAQTQSKTDLVVWYTKDEYLRIANWAYRK
jgi:hypothetical protein